MIKYNRNIRIIIGIFCLFNLFYLNNGYSQSFGDNPKYTKEFDKFARAIHLTETNSKIGNIIGDGGRALGPLQIHEICYLDAKEKVGGKYKDVVSLEFSKKVLYFYCLKYESSALRNNNFETLSKLWNGGPQWKNKTGIAKKNLDNYWGKVKKNLITNNY